MKPAATIFLLLLCFPSFGQKTDVWLEQLLRKDGSPLMQNILSKPDGFQFQVIYTKIDRNRKGRRGFKNYYLNVDRNRYFNPASTVKLPTALAALEKINRIKMHGVNRSTPMLTDSSYPGQTKVERDTTSQTGLPSVEHYIKKIFLVSDNDAYNRLYEFVGQEELNRTLWRKGYKDVRITRRFVPMTEEQNRHTNAITFIENGQTIYAQAPAYSRISFDFRRPVFIGKAHYNWEDSLISKPMDFTRHNNLPLEDLQQIMQSVLFPRSVPVKKRFDLSDDDYNFIQHYLSAYPYESEDPKYDTSEFFSSYTKFFFKAGRKAVPEQIRIYNKPGWSYGFLTDAAYVKDEGNGIEFMLSAVIYVNADGVLNDNKYEYETIGLPFFHELFRVIYAYELERKRE